MTWVVVWDFTLTSSHTNRLHYFSRVSSTRFSPNNWNWFFFSFDKSPFSQFCRFEPTRPYPHPRVRNVCSSLLRTNCVKSIAHQSAQKKKKTDIRTLYPGLIVLYLFIREKKKNHRNEIKSQYHYSLVVKCSLQHGCCVTLML